jgi:sec-independent protein translocase protein TatB
VFDLSIPKLLVLAVIALVVFGPNELPKIAAQAGRVLRDLRQIAESAKNDLREGLGPELADFEIEDLNPRRLAQKHLFGDLNADQAAQQQPARQAAANGTPVTPGKHPPSGPDLTDLHGADQARQGDRPHGPRRGDRQGGTSPGRKQDL